MFMSIVSCTCSFDPYTIIKIQFHLEDQSLQNKWRALSQITNILIKNCKSWRHQAEAASSSKTDFDTQIFVKYNTM